MRTAILVGFLCLCMALNPEWEYGRLEPLVLATFAIAGATDTIELLNRMFPGSEG